MKKIGKIFFLSLLFPASLALADTVKFEASVDRNEVTLNEAVTLTLVVSSDGVMNDGEPKLPTLQGFDVLNQWAQSESRSVFENGKFQYLRKQIYKYVLAPKKPGTYTIGGASVMVKGNEMLTEPITVKVMEAGQRPSTAGPNGAAKNKKGQQPGAQAPDDEDPRQQMFGMPKEDDDDEDFFNQLLKRRGLAPGQRPGGGGQGQGQGMQSEAPSGDVFFIRAEASKSKAYVNEEVVANWYLYTRAGLQGFDALKYPDLKGFWKEDLELASRLNFQSEILNGVAYNKALLVSYALFPLSPGKKVIDSYKAKATVIDMNSSMSLFGIGQPRNLISSSKELTLDVLPLPSEGRPESFSGAVGQFNITGSVSATTAKVNQPVSLKIRFQGRGNVKAIELPPLHLPDSLQVYDTKKDSQFAKSGDGFKEFEVLLIPKAAGDIVVPPIQLSYFDPKAKRYVSTKTPEFSLKVLPGDGPSAAALPQASGVPAEGAKATEPTLQENRDIRYLRTSKSFFPEPAVHGKIISVLFLLIWGWFGVQFWRLIFGGVRDHQSEVRKRALAKLKVARVKLKKQDWRGVGVECSNAVLGTLGEVTGIGGASIALEQMLAILPSTQDALKTKIRNFLNYCELISFAPTEMMETLKKERKVISDAEKIIEALFQEAKRSTSVAQASARVSNP